MPHAWPQFLLSAFSIGEPPFLLFGSVNGSTCVQVESVGSGMAAAQSSDISLETNIPKPMKVGDAGVSAQIGFSTCAVLLFISASSSKRSVGGALLKSMHERGDLCQRPNRAMAWRSACSGEGGATPVVLWARGFGWEGSFKQ